MLICLSDHLHKWVLWKWPPTLTSPSDEVHHMKFIRWSPSQPLTGFSVKTFAAANWHKWIKAERNIRNILSIRNIRSILGILILNSDSLWIHSDFQTPKFRVTFRLMPAVLPGELCKAMTARRLCQATLQGELSAKLYLRLLLFAISQASSRRIHEVQHLPRRLPFSWTVWCPVHADRVLERLSIGLQKEREFKIQKFSNSPIIQRLDFHWKVFRWFVDSLTEEQPKCRAAEYHGGRARRSKGWVTA